MILLQQFLASVVGCGIIVYVIYAAKVWGYLEGFADGVKRRQCRH